MQEVDVQGESSGMGLKISKIDFKGIGVVEWNRGSGMEWEQWNEIGVAEWNENNGMRIGISNIE